MALAVGGVVVALLAACLNGGHLELAFPWARAIEVAWFDVARGCVDLNL